MIAPRLLDELKERLTSAYGHRLHAVVLFGSEAQGEGEAVFVVEPEVELRESVGVNFKRAFASGGPHR